MPTLLTRACRVAAAVVVGTLVTAVFVPTLVRAQSDRVSEDATEAAAEPPRLKDRGPTTANNPPSGLWGSSPDEQNDSGLPKATGSAYNYTHIALSFGVIAVVGFGLVVLIRRYSAARAD